MQFSTEYFEMDLTSICFKLNKYCELRKMRLKTGNRRAAQGYAQCLRFLS